MKCLIILAVVSLATCVPVDNNRHVRSIGHHDYYDTSSYGAAYHEQPIATYDDVRVGTPVDIPIKTEIHTTSAQRYNVHVPVTYTYTVNQPVHKTSTIYHSASPVYHAPSPVYHAASPVYLADYASSTGYQTPTVYSAPSYVDSSSWNSVSTDPWC